MLIYISFNLDENNQIQLRQYFHGLIPVDITAILELLRALEYNKNISWQDVNLLKEAMRVIRRLDLVKKLTEYECKRDLMLLLDFYARRIVRLDSYCCTVPVKKVAGQLERLMEIARDRINFKIISLTADSTKEIRKVLLNFQEVIDCRELEFSWNEFTMLVVMAGEVIAVTYSNEEQLEESVLELCSTAAEELCSRMVELGSWEEFSTQVKERYNLVYKTQSMESTTNLSIQQERVQIVQHLTDAIFFPLQTNL